METIRDALEVSAEMHKVDSNNVSDYVQRHLRSLSIWEELRYSYFLFCCARAFNIYFYNIFAASVPSLYHIPELF